MYPLISSILRHPDKDRVVLDMYWKILGFVTGLEEQTRWTLEENFSGVRDLAVFVCALHLYI
jgi:hypothetical protein